MQGVLAQQKLLRDLVFIAADLLVLLLFAVGLLSPLTPSVGRPTLSDILIFVGMPVLILTVRAVISRSRLAKVFFLGQLLFVVLIDAWVLHGHLPW